MDGEFDIFGVGIDPLDRAEALKRCENFLRGDVPCRVFTPNPQMLLACRKSSELRELINSAELRIADGVGISVAARIRGIPSFPRAAGIDTASDILLAARDMGLSVYLLGGREGVAERAAKNLRDSIDGINICGYRHGYFEREGLENECVLEDIRRAAPHILFVCLGFPTQEMWINKNIGRLPSVRLAMGLGGSLDVWAGDKKRAPETFRALGLEWLWRTALEPRRLGIFIDIPRFLTLSLIESRSKKSHPSRS